MNSIIGGPYSFYHVLINCISILRKYEILDTLDIIIEILVCKMVTSIKIQTKNMHKSILNALIR
jgi:hypothetical protein